MFYSLDIREWLIIMFLFVLANTSYNVFQQKVKSCLNDSQMKCFKST